MNQITIGDFELSVISGGTMRADGGNMFGVVPRVLWARICRPDDENRISMDTNCLLVRTPDSLGLIDTGYGDKAPEKIRRRNCMEDGAPLLQNLNNVGVSADDLDWVILTHLHFDHAGGATTVDDSGNLQPVFRRARHFVQQFEWDDALSGRAEFAGAYHSDDFLPLQNSDLLTLVNEEHEIVPGITTCRTDGHTRGQQLVRLISKAQTAVYVADLCPTSAHLRKNWTMAYDQFPLTTRRTKPEILGEIADQHQIMILPHDPDAKIVRLQRSERTEFEVLPPV
ncbi:MAG: MBL fold metallo-hydrolase [Fuerstiella sp.]|nr:MBL fold metallo-hydrolase [Fuerstiella sp.]